MKQRKITLIIIALSSIVFFMSALAYKFYATSSELSAHIEEQVPIIVAKRDIKEGSLITKHDLTQQLLPKSYIGFAPLTPAEINGKYAKVTILASEPFRMEKLSYEKPEINVTKEEAFAQAKDSIECTTPIELNSSMDTVTLDLSMFRNFDTTLKVDDKIDIISVMPKSSTAQSNRFSNAAVQQFDTKYIAIGVPIVSFISKGKFVKDALSSKRDKVNNIVSSELADQVVLELEPKELSNFLSLYYTSQALNAQKVYNANNSFEGHLWIVNSTLNSDEKSLKLKEKMMYDYKRVVKKRKAVKKKRTVKREKKEKVLIDYES